MKKYKKSILAWSWDHPAKRINSELGLTLYKFKRLGGKYRYKITFEEINERQNRKSNRGNR